MTEIRIRTRWLLIALLVGMSIVAGRVTGYAQDVGGLVFLKMFGIGTSATGSKVIEQPMGGSLIVYYDRGAVWTKSPEDKLDYETLIFTAPLESDIQNMTIKMNSLDIVVELVNGMLFYGEFDPLHNTWTFIPVKLIPGNGVSESPEKVVGDALYALSTGDVQVSRDTGRTWQEDTTGLGSEVLTDIALDSSQNVYGVSPSRLFRQPPDTLMWRNVSTFPNLPGSAISSVFVDRRNRIFVGASSNGVYASTDNGNTWNPDTAGMGKRQAINLGDDAFGNIYAPIGSALYRSTGAGQP